MDALLLQCETWKRFSDLQLLHKHLESVHLRSQPTSNLPELVRAKYFGKLTGGRRGRKTTKTSLSYACVYQAAPTSTCSKFK